MSPSESTPSPLVSARLPALASVIVGSGVSGMDSVSASVTGGPVGGVPDSGGGVVDGAGVHVGLREGVGGRAVGVVPGGQRGGRAGDGGQAGERVGDAHRVEGDVAGVLDGEGVGDDVALGVDAVAVGVGQRSGLGEGDGRVGGEVDGGGVGVGHVGAGRRGAGRGGGVDDGAGVDVGLGHGVGGAAVGVIPRSQRAHGTGDGRQAGQGIAHTNRVERDVAGVLDVERIGDDVSGGCGAVAVRVRPAARLRQRDRWIGGERDRLAVGVADIRSGGGCAGGGGGVVDRTRVDVGLGEGVGGGAVGVVAGGQRGGGAGDGGQTGERVGDAHRVERDVAGVLHGEGVGEDVAFAVDAVAVGVGQRSGLGQCDGRVGASGTDSVSVSVTSGPVGGVPVAVAVLSTWPLSMSVWVRV